MRRNAEAEWSATHNMRQPAVDMPGGEVCARRCPGPMKISHHRAGRRRTRRALASSPLNAAREAVTLLAGGLHWSRHVPPLLLSHGPRSALLSLALSGHSCIESFPSYEEVLGLKRVGLTSGTSSVLPQMPWHPQMTRVPLLPACAHGVAGTALSIHSSAHVHRPCRSRAHRQSGTDRPTTRPRAWYGHASM